MLCHGMACKSAERLPQCLLVAPSAPDIHGEGAAKPSKLRRALAGRRSTRASAGYAQTGSRSGLTTIKEYREAGKIRNIGLSEVGIEQIERAREIVPIAAVQNHYNLSERRSEDVVDYCAREEIAFVPFFPLRGDGGRALAEIAKRHGATSTQIALAWLLRRSPAMLPIPGTLSLEHVRENLAALEIELTDAEFDAIR
jgi:aryl-alcohol dehydrogenase-like predicted oxidoreductase